MNPTDKLKNCCLAARGLYFELAALAERLNSGGYILVNSEPAEKRIIAQQCGCTESDLDMLLPQLESAGLITIDKGIIGCPTVIKKFQAKELRRQLNRRAAQIRWSKNRKIDAQNHAQNNAQTYAQQNSRNDMQDKELRQNSDAQTDAQTYAQNYAQENCHKSNKTVERNETKTEGYSSVNLESVNYDQISVKRDVVDNRNRSINLNILPASEGQVDSIDLTTEFERLWEDYPAERRLGKGRSFGFFCCSVWNKERLALIRKALENYKAYVEDNRLNIKYVRMADRWFASWEDWLDYKPKSQIESEKAAKRTEIALKRAEMRRQEVHHTETGAIAVKRILEALESKMKIRRKKHAKKPSGQGASANQDHERGQPARTLGSPLQTQTKSKDIDQTNTPINPNTRYPGKIETENNPCQIGKQKT